MLFLKLIIITGILIMPMSVAAQTNSPQPVQDPQQIIEEIDSRKIVLQSYLTEENSPLAAHVDELIAAADQYGIDWKLVPAISGVESNFGKRIPGGHEEDSTSYNGWGWGVYGDKVLKFNSWGQGIEKVTKGLREGYINKGLTDPYSINKKYASNPEWGWQVAHFLQDLETYSEDIHQKYGDEIKYLKAIAENQRVLGEHTQRFDNSQMFFSEARLIVNDYSLGLELSEY